MKNSAKIILIFTAFLFLSSTLLAGDFSSYSSSVLAIDARPKKVFLETRIFVMHPMIKQKESIYHYHSRLTWKGSRGTRTITKFRVVKGIKPKGKSLVGRSAKFKYISDELRKFCSSSVSAWEIKRSMELDGKSFQGYSFKVMFNGRMKEGKVYLNGDGTLRAMSLGFPEEGLSHNRNMKENATVWYFTGSGSGLKISEVHKYKIRKQRGIPVITADKSRFSGF